jgi:DNA-directed RNA polymerase subunit RPC12/RpoP
MSSRWFHLFAKCCGTGWFETLVVRPGADWLVIGSQGVPWLGDQDEAGEEGFKLSPITTHGQDYLVAVSRGVGRLRVNGWYRPKIAILEERDHIQLDADTVLRVALYQEPQIGPATPELAGKSCPVCLAPFSIDPPTTVYTCGHCGVHVHCEGEEKSADERLECVMLAPTCPACGMPVVMKRGYLWQPEDGHD